jgi:uncharacterized protein YggU (UPF0235/DUF167 family)
MYIHVRVEAGSKKEYLDQLDDTHFKVSVKEPAEQNMANWRVIEMIAEHFGKPTSKIRMISGHHSPSKILSIVETIFS